ncbi:MAG: CARDB domain-containing protein, partial [Planctomycetota bacterium]
LVILDDSYSMQDRGSGASVWEAARAAAERVGAVAQQNPRHRLTVLRTSQVLLPGGGEPLTATGAAETPGLIQRVRAMQPTQSAPPLHAAVTRAAQFAASQTDGAPVVAYVLSDFRDRDTQPTDRMEAALADLRASCSAVQLASCSGELQENLGVTGLTLLPGARASGMELTGEVTVENFGARASPRVTVRLLRDGQALPAVELGDVPAGESATARFPVRFDQPGDHTLLAELDADAVAADNRRYFAAGFPDRRTVILADGSPGGAEGFVYQTALRPADDRGDIPTGWRPLATPADALASGVLDSAAAVLLLDVPQFTPAAARALRRFVDAGGGVFLGLGPSVDRENYNRLLFGQADTALLPATLDVPTQVDAAPSAGGGDVTVAPHPLFRVFSGDRNSFLSLLRVNYYQGVAVGDLDALPAGVRVIASLPGGAPLMIEASDAEAPGAEALGVGGDRPGRVIVLCTSVSRPRDAVEGWSNLGRSPVFPVIVNELAAYLAAPRLAETPVTVAQPWAQVDAGGPAGGSVSTGQPRFSPWRPNAAAGDGTPHALAPQAAGWYQSQLADRSSDGPSDEPSGGPFESTLLAVNVAAGEGDLSAPPLQDIRTQFGGAGISVLAASQLLRDDNTRADAGVGLAMGLALMVLLVAERALAVAASYHQTSPDVGAA